MTTILDEILVQARNLDNSVARLRSNMTAFPSEVLNWEGPSKASTSWLIVQTTALAALAVAASSSDKEQFVIVPNSRLTSFQDSIKSLSEFLDSMQSMFDQLKSWGGFERFDSNGTIFSKSGGEIGFSPSLAEFKARVDAALDAFQPISLATKYRGIKGLAGYARALGDQIAEGSDALSHIRVLIEEVNGSLQSTNATRESSAAVFDSIKSDFDFITKIKTVAEENERKLNSASENADKILTLSGLLETRIIEYDQKFSVFDKLLSSREDALKSGTETLTSISSAFGEKNRTIDEMVEKSKNMLGGATVSGLASAYRDQVNDINKELNNARISYYFSVFALVLGAMVALNVFSGFGVGITPMPTVSDLMPTGNAAVQILAGLGSRALLILPPLLLASFSSRRYRELFQLRGEYIHKYTMAASVQGFKIQAPSYEEAVAAAVFKELLSNPSILKPKSEVNEDNGFLDRIIMPRVDKALAAWGKVGDS